MINRGEQMDWLPAVTSSSVAAVVMGAAGVLYQRSVAHAFDARIEAFKSQLKTDEERFSADLRAKDADIAALRSGALSSLTSRQVELSRRRIVAIEAIWHAVVDLGKYRLASQMVQVINMDFAIEEASKQTASGRSTREFAEGLWKANNIEDVKADTSADKERLFVPPITWALFSAYRTLVMHAVMQLLILKSGVGSNLVSNPKNLIDMAKSALPHQSAYLDEHGASGLSYLVEELHDRVLASLMDALKITDVDDAAVAQAAQIMDAVKRSTADMNSSNLAS